MLRYLRCSEKNNDEANKIEKIFTKIKSVSEYLRCLITNGKKTERNTSNVFWFSIVLCLYFCCILISLSFVRCRYAAEFVGVFPNNKPDGIKLM